MSPCAPLAAGRPAVRARAQRPGLLLLLLLALLPLPGAHADKALHGPGRPVPAPRGVTDADLLLKAARIQARMNAHLSPEGLLAYVHAVGAGPAQLSHDVLGLSDAAIWTGCYAAAMACRWSVTRDPEALEVLRRLAGGLELLSEASGRPGGLVRNVGRPLPGSAPQELSEPSPMGRGFWCRADVSRDQLSGVVLGWALIGRFVDDAPLRERARAALSALARRLYADRLWLRDLRGKKTSYGELRPDVEGIPFTRNGRLAAIGLAPFTAAVMLDPAPDLEAARRRLAKDGYEVALPEQFTWLPSLLGPSNVNMTMLSLLTVALTGRERAVPRAQAGLRALSEATVGWWNGGLRAMALLGGVRAGRAALVDELRAVLHGMSEEEVPFAQETERRIAAIPTIQQRGNAHWAWKDELGLFRDVPPGATARRAHTHTRADWLFAYWLARAAQELVPGPATVAPGTGR